MSFGRTSTGPDGGAALYRAEVPSASARRRKRPRNTVCQRCAVRTARSCTVLHFGRERQHDPTREKPCNLKVSVVLPDRIELWRSFTNSLKNLPNLRRPASPVYQFVDQS